MARTFGVTSTVSGTGVAMVLNSVTKKSSVEIAEAKDENGKVTDQVAYSREEQVTVQGLLDGSHTVKAGDIVTAGGLSGIINDQTISEKEGFTEVEFTISKKDAATQVAYSAGA